MVVNICKKREWDKFLNEYSNNEYFDYYFTYKLTRNKIGNYLNTWFVDGLTIKDNIIHIDSLITLKKVDSETYNSLYRKKFNPLRILIRPNYQSIKEYTDKVEKIGRKNKQSIKHIMKYDMKCVLRSIDDSSYGIWWDGNENIDYLKIQRYELMKWVSQFNTKNLLNGEKLLEKCIELGANPNQKDYN